MKEVKKLVIIAFVLILLTSFVSANLGSYPQNDCVSIKVLSNCSVSITQIESNLHTWTINAPMTLLGGQTYNYSFCNTSDLGQYKYSWYGDCLDCSGGLCGNDFWITTTGEQFSLGTILTYIFFLLVCLTILVFSYKLATDNPIEKDTLSDAQLYETHKKSEVKFYIELLKKKMWIVGVFGVYLSLLGFLALLNQLVFRLGITELYYILNNTLVVLGWLLVPFILFWMVYIIIYLWKTTEAILKRQLGGFKA